MTQIDGPQLDTEAVERFHATGFLGPFSVFNETEAERLRERIDRETEEPGPADSVKMHRHLDSPAVYQVCSHPEIVRRIQSLYGENLLLWASILFDKSPGSEEIPWHQDTVYFDVSPPVTVTAWVALTESSTSNGCLQLVPGSHRERVPHETDDSYRYFDVVVDSDADQTERAIDMEMDPGDCLLFTEQVLHRSRPNTSENRRFGLSARITVPFARVNADQPAIQISGSDEFGINPLTEPPSR